MSRYTKLALTAIALPLFASTLLAQDAKNPGARTEMAKPSTDSTTKSAKDSSTEAAKKISTLPTI